VHLWGRSVAVSLQAGRVQFMEEGTGCLVRDESGPRTVAGQFGQPDYDANYSTVTGAYLELNETNNRHVQVNPCGGIARTETWRLRYDRVLQGWELEGSLSGVQERIAYEDERYVSDDGAFSFVIRSGASPSEDGWRLEFRVLAGVLQVDGDNNHDGVVNSDEPDIDLPGDPVFFWYRVGPTDGGWDAVDERPFVLVAAEGSDVVGRAEPQTGDFEVQWQ